MTPDRKPGVPVAVLGWVGIAFLVLSVVLWLLWLSR